jgi:hypothetical protein
MVGAAMAIGNRSLSVKDRLGEGWPLERVMGSRVDCVEPISSLTPFEWAARSVAEANGEPQTKARAHPQVEAKADSHVEAKSRAEAKDREECEILGALAAAVLATASRQGFARCEFAVRVVGE